MKRKSVLLFIGLTFLICCFKLVYAQSTKASNLETTDYVPNKETAIKIAEAIWLPLYGESIYKQRPFIAELKDSTVWIVKGTMHTRKGGVPYIEIQKSDCKILKVKHGK